MDLFEPLTINLTLPKRYTPSIKVAGNVVHKLLFRTTKLTAKIENSGFSGYFKLTTGLTAPLDVVYLKAPNARGKCPDSFASLKAKETFTLANWHEDAELVWEHFPEHLFATRPEAINAQWQNEFNFKEETSEQGVPGLRKPQLGALHAIAGYFATDLQVEPGLPLKH